VSFCVLLVPRMRDASVTRRLDVGQTWSVSLASTNSTIEVQQAPRPRNRKGQAHFVGKPGRIPPHPRWSFLPAQGGLDPGHLVRL